jgi:thymidylate synthase (FAD)
MKALYIDHMGNDLSVVRAAKVSFANDITVSEFITKLEAAQFNANNPDRPAVRSHEALLNYLATHGHWTPFAHATITLRMAAPVPIRTQCFKHKVGFIENEESRRYISSRPVLFVPDEFRLAPDGDKVKQGSAGVHPQSAEWRQSYKQRCENMIEFYMNMVDAGVAPEQARFVLPQGCEVNWYWTGSLYAYAAAFNGRTDSHAQGEVRDLFAEIGSIIEPLFPYSWRALTGAKL